MQPPTFLAFLNYAVTAAASGPAPIKALAPGLQAAADTLDGSVVAREGQQGAGQGLTRSKKDVLRAMRVFVQDTNAVLLVPTYRQRPDVLKLLLPQGLMHLTDANATELPVRFEAFADALAAQQADLGAAPSTAATGLLAELAAATAAQGAGLKVAKETIGSLGGQWADACELLWPLHCTALGTHWSKPLKAEAFFNYGLLPRRNSARAVARAADKAPE